MRIKTFQDPPTQAKTKALMHPPKTIFQLLIIFTTLLSVPLGAQTIPSQIGSISDDYKTKIGIDMSVPDFDTRTIDANVIGDRLAKILTFLQENYTHSPYERRLITIIGNQNEKLGSAPFHIKNLKLVSVSKHGDALTIKYNVQLEKNLANVKKADLSFAFIDGVSEDESVNELFSVMSHYVQVKEQYEQSSCS